MITYTIMDKKNPISISKHIAGSGFNAEAFLVAHIHICAKKG